MTDVGPSSDGAPSRDECLRALRLLHPDGEVCELRIREFKRGTSRPQIVSGYFTTTAALHAAAMMLCREGDTYEAATLLLNPAIEACLARSPEKLTVSAKHTTSDKQIRNRTRLLVDIDPKRPVSDVMATEAERKGAQELAHQVRELLEALNWGSPLVMDTGNGVHMIWATDLPADDGGLVKRVLAGLAAHFDNDIASIDTSCGNASRLTRVPGTWARKGASTEERPHRYVWPLHVPEKLGTVTLEQLEVVAGWAGSSMGKVGGQGSGVARYSPHSIVDVGTLLHKHGLVVSKHSPWSDGQRWELESCPADPSHRRTAVVLQFSNGHLLVKCLKATCSLANGKSLRDLLGAGALREVPGNGLPMTEANKSLLEEIDEQAAIMEADDIIPLVETCVPTLVTPPLPPEPVRASALQSSAFQVGQRVRPSDRENVGTIVQIQGDIAQVHFRSPDGSEATKPFRLGELRAESFAARRKPNLFTLGELRKRKPKPSLVQGLLDQGEVACLYGQPSCGKTFLAIDMACSIALGKPLWSRRVAQGPVLYVLGEGVGGFEKRADAWLIGSRSRDSTEALDSTLTTADAPINLLDPDSVAWILEQGKRLAPKLIVLDTLARCLAGADENSSQDMGQAVDSAYGIAQETGATVLIVHHTGKNGDGERGSSALRAGVDAMYKVTKDAERSILRLTCDKSKEREPFPEMRFDLRVETVSGIDESGFPRTSCYPEMIVSKEAAGMDQVRSTPERVAGCVRHAVYELGSSFPGGSASRIELRDHLMGERGIKKSTVNKGITRAIERGLIEIRDAGRTQKLQLSETGKALFNSVPCEAGSRGYVGYSGSNEPA